MKKIIWVVILIFAAIGIYYTGIYTYFIENKISEELPQMPSGVRENAEPEILKEGSFVDADFFHKGSGRAKIIGYPDGKRILRFEDFEVINGPDVYVYLSPSTSPTGDLKSLGGYLDLGLLKGNTGNQNYELPDIDLANYKSVVLWCKRFGVLFPYAVLK